MIKNYLLMVWYQFTYRPTFALINVMGLTLALSSSVLIMLYVRDELRFDHWVPQADRIVRLHSAFYRQSRPPLLAVRSAGRVMEALESYASEYVEEGVRLVPATAKLLQGNQVYRESIFLSDESFFKVFDLPFIKSSADVAYTKPMDLVISRKIAQKVFGDVNAVGRVLGISVEGTRFDLKVSGVIEDLPPQSHMKLDILVVFRPSLFESAPQILDTWTSLNTYTYFKLKPGASVDKFQALINQWINEDSPMVGRVPAGSKPTDWMRLNIMPIKQIHLRGIKDAGNQGDMKPLGDMRMVVLFTAVTLMILLIGAVNFINLTTARASIRAKEVAMRKVMGARRPQIAGQFLFEALVTVLISLFIAIVVAELALPWYNQIIGRELSINVQQDPLFAVATVIGALILALISGAYPAFYLSRFKPAHTLTANRSGERVGAGRVRSLLVIFQFAVSVGLAVCTAVIFSQMLYMRQLDLGYSYTDKLVISDLNPAEINQTAIINELRKIPGVTDVVLSSEVPSQDWANNTPFRLLGGDPNTENTAVLNRYSVGIGFFEAYGMQLLAGRTFSYDYGSDSGDDSRPVEEVARTIILNESAMRSFGFSSPEEAIGQILIGQLDQWERFEIIGIAKDVKFRSIKFPVRPSFFINDPNSHDLATVSFKTKNVSRLIAEIEAVWQELVPLVPLEYKLLSEMVRDQYRSEDNQKRMLLVFSALAILIACLGLYGLASFTIDRRRREIGIRKVHGGRVSDILSLLLRQFSTPVIVANLLAWPLSAFVMHYWLQSFTNRINSWWILLLCVLVGLASVLLVSITVVGNVARAAKDKPANALRYE